MDSEQGLAARGSRLGRSGVAASVGLSALVFWCGVAAAAPPPIQVPTEEQLQPGEQAPPAGALRLPEQGSRGATTCSATCGGCARCSASTASPSRSQETSEVLGNVTGGAKQGFDYDGLTQMLLQLDTQRAFGWYGGTFNVSALQIHGRNLSADNLLTLADRERHRGGPRHPPVGAVVRAEIPRGGPARRQDRPAKPRPGIHGQPERAATSSTPCSAGRWCPRPTCPAAARPIRCRRSACGVRARPIDPLTFLVGVFNGSPVANNNGDPQHAESVRHQLSAERRRAGDRRDAIHLPVARHACSTPTRRSRWRASTSSASGTTRESFADQQLRQYRPVAGQSREQRHSACSHRGDYGIYAVADQMVWQDPERRRPDDQRLRPRHGDAAGRPQPDRSSA